MNYNLIIEQILHISHFIILSLIFQFFSFRIADQLKPFRQRIDYIFSSSFIPRVSRYIASYYLLSLFLKKSNFSELKANKFFSLYFDLPFSKGLGQSIIIYLALVFLFSSLIYIIKNNKIRMNFSDYTYKKVQNFT